MGSNAENKFIWQYRTPYLESGIKYDFIQFIYYYLVCMKNSPWLLKQGNCTKQQNIRHREDYTCVYSHGKRLEV